MKISVIVPVYNVENYIEKCLLSIKNQSLKDFECLIIDDGSKDNSIDKAHRLIDDDVRFTIYHKENGGLSDARNYGMDLAIGDYLCFVDSDDYIDEDMLEKVYEVAKENDSDITCFDFIYEYEDGHQEFSKGGYKEISNYQEDKDLLFIIHSANNKIFKRTFMENKRFIYGLSYEDLASIPGWIGQANNVTYIDKAFYHYMQRDNSISHSYDLRIFDIYKALDNIKKELNLNSEDINEFYIKQCLIALTLKIREIEDKKKRMKFYLINANQLEKNYPKWYRNRNKMKDKLSFKWNIVATLLYFKQITILDLIYKK